MIQVRKSTYRDEEGWTVSGYPTEERTGWPVSIFFEHESAARHHAEKIKSGIVPMEIEWDYGVES